MLAISDVTRLSGYQEVPAGCPVWKKAMIEKKNKQLEEDAMVNYSTLNCIKLDYKFEISNCDERERKTGTLNFWQTCY